MNSDYKVRLIVLSHGSFAKGLVETSMMLFGQTGRNNVYPICLGPEENTDEYLKRVTEKLEDPERTLVLIDIYGGSPFNTVVKLSREKKIYALAGINVPLMLEILVRRETMSAREILEEVTQLAEGSIVNVTNVIEERLKKQGE
ncbi:MAG: hypothetical protein IJS38_02610 [Erysipelotrichaceae bacterium]|nr:hypothetical protein [Erysipelotrichaceae bacterium]